ncbi:MULTISPECIES: hypothetical protein [unclassified Halomonas]|nr:MULTISPECIES: hypothetical protein [unclassified Halomonas]MDT0502257.1 hypothetical protein [Halomonas sp. PAR7]MDT0513327.1 hypothetical protein [Halomonas sp. LES1]MDT0591907.1 hypothetical protein [Halomonas sp. PAR8]
MERPGVPAKSSSGTYTEKTPGIQLLGFFSWQDAAHAASRMPAIEAPLIGARRPEQRPEYLQALTGKSPELIMSSGFFRLQAGFPMRRVSGGALHPIEWDLFGPGSLA